MRGNKSSPIRSAESYTEYMGWEEKAAKYKAQVEASFPKIWLLSEEEKKQYAQRPIDFPIAKGYFKQSEIEITQLNATELVAKLAAGQLKAVDVVSAFSHRAVLAHQLTNCLIDFFYEDAVQHAKFLDDYYEMNKKPIGPLHGLPISLKDQFKIKGRVTSMGYVSWLDDVSADDSALTTVLRSAGAVFYVKTNIPQSLMCGETINNIMGRTLNPFNTKLTCGGSSGGEGALICMRGSVLGLGTDIGGSIRIPAAFQMLYGLRPSHGRTPYSMLKNSMDGQETVHSVVGPIAHTIDDLELCIKAILSMAPWNLDPKVMELPWRQEMVDELINQKLSFGIMVGDSLVQPQPPVLRALETAKAALIKAGHEVFEIMLPDMQVSYDIITRVFFADGGEDIQRDLKASGEPVVPNILQAEGDYAKPITLLEAWQLQKEKYAHQAKVLQFWKDQKGASGRKMDGLLCACAPFGTARHNKYHWVQ